MVNVHVPAFAAPVSVTTPETLPANCVVGELMPVVPERVMAMLNRQFSLSGDNIDRDHSVGAASQSSCHYGDRELANRCRRVVSRPARRRYDAIDRDRIRVLARPCQRCLLRQENGRWRETSSDRRGSGPDVRSLIVVEADADAQAVNVDGVVVSRRRPRAKGIIPDNRVVADVGCGDDDSIS